MDCSDEEVLDRYLTVFQEYVVIAPILADKIEEFGRVRNELQLLVAEIDKRKIKLPEENAQPTNTI